MGVMNSLTPDLEKVFENSNMQEHTSFYTGKRFTLSFGLVSRYDIIQLYR